MSLSESNKTLDASIKMPTELSRNFEASVPADLYAERGISEGCIRLFCVIKQLHNAKTKFCTASNKTLAYYTGNSERTVRLHLKQLREAGFLTVKLDVRGEGRNRQVRRYLHVSNDKIGTCREIVKTWNDKENTKQIEDFENDEDADCEEQDEARDADAGEEIVSFEAEKSVQQAELIPQETEEPKDIFERTLWKHPETCECIKQSGSVKAQAFKRWCKVTKDGKLTEVCDLLRMRYREMVEARKRQGVNWNALEVFLNPVVKKWETDWNKTGSHVSAFTNTAPRGVTVLNRTTTRTATQATATIENGTAEVRQATETVSETATVLGGDNLHLRDDYQKGTRPRDWVTIAVEKKLSGLNLSKGVVDSWGKITDWRFCPKELKQVVATLYDEGYRWNDRFECIVEKNYEDKLVNAIAGNAERLGEQVGDLDGELWWQLIEVARRLFDEKNNYTKEERDTFDTLCSADGTCWYRKPEEECVATPTEWFEGKFPFAEFIREHPALILAKRKLNEACRFIVQEARRLMSEAICVISRELGKACV